ncbi:MAG: ferrochelatase [Pseudomonadota bacterium]|nr:ferrochelatase [Pseudomonadota bacterium]
MMQSRFPPGHAAVATGRIGVLLVNLGTPDAPDVRSVRRYLAEFLSDRRVIEVPRLIWWLVLNLFILRFRPKRTAHAYAKVWMADSNESPLRHHTRRQAELLAARFAGDDRVIVDWAMRYGNPSMASVIARLKEQGIERLLVVPLYPQYSATTTATVVDRLGEVLAGMRWQPAIRVAPPWHDDPGYVEALARSVEADRLANGEVDTVIASFHGLPKEYFEKGDPYYCHCAKTARLLRERLGTGEEGLRLTFQSRFGPREWLQPYTDHTLAALPGQGIRRVAVIMPGFAADCVETLEEIAIAGRETFMAAGGETFRTIPCLNDSGDHIDLLEAISRRELGGWI